MKRKKIKKIRDAEKIAAGEVVERPANVVKELIENSIDAGAKQIRVMVKKAGKSLIQVIDDGIGIAPDDIEFAFERHTSSKIRSIEDLDKLSTLGFRGEALASITAISQVEIISRAENEDLGVQLSINGGIIVDKKQIPCPVGTNIKIKNIFYNIPARQKFLKSDSTELGHITDIIQRYALAYPDIHFIYRHNDLDVLNCPSNDLPTTVFHIYGKLSAKLMKQIDYCEKDNYFKINGLLGHPEISKKNRNYSSLFVNHRYVISDLLYRAIQEAYKGTLMVGKYPFFVIHIELDPSIIDFNIHPKKLHIRFENDDFIYNKVYNVIRTFVEEEFIKKEANYISTEIDDFVSKKEAKIQITEEEGAIEKPHAKLEVRKQVEELSKMEKDIVDKKVQLQLTDQVTEEKANKKQMPETYIRDKFIITKNFPKIRLIPYTGQLSNNIYVVLEGINQEGEEGLYILDQHAASERVRKEYFLDMIESLKVSKQQLISPLKIEVSPSEKFFLEENLENINKLGFNFEHFGGTTFILREIPTIIDKLPDINIIKEIISDITDIGKDKSFAETKEEIINYLACHRSIRGGDELTLNEIRNLLIELGNCKDPFHCAHGRPTLKFISFKELDKLFKRKI
ncbi:MAG: DNA mismatch repair endonuclease MutL [Promethearchaeota archaeon]|nr:MAG: DNA mismatch repair endonuclease MutL [Candidatus Lokiarchaeota archaeon]